MLTKGKFLQLIEAMKGDNNFLVAIINACFKLLPPAFTWKLSHDLYFQYYWTGPVYTLTNNITGVVTHFASPADASNYLQSLGYKASTIAVSNAFKNRSITFCNHTFDRPEKEEITYYE